MASCREKLCNFVVKSCLIHWEAEYLKSIVENNIFLLLFVAKDRFIFTEIYVHSIQKNVAQKIHPMVFLCKTEAIANASPSRSFVAINLSSNWLFETSEHVLPHD